MSVSNFLFEGSSPDPTTSYGTTAENMPRWLSEYAQGVMGRSAAVGNEPYQAYGGPRLADMTQDQNRAYELTRSNVGSYAPYLQSASRTFPQAAQEYMNPYSENVINRAGTLANRALNEKFLPSLSAKFGSRGSDVRSSAYRRAADRGVRDLTEGMQEQANAELARGYENAGTMFNQDATRMGTLGQQVQQMGLTDAAALESAGRSQQGETQKSLDLGYEDFERQRDYPRENLNWMADMMRGAPQERTVNTTQTGTADYVNPSPLQQFGSIATGIGGILQAYKSARGGRVNRYRRGGVLRRYYDGR